jgi:putative hydrolase of the HAD superfamily
MIKVLVFDLGKVILPFDHRPVIPAIHARSALRDEVTVEEMFQHFFDWGRGIYMAYESGRVSTEEFFKGLSDRFKLDLTIEEFGHIWNSIFWEDPEVIAIVRGLKARGYPLFLLSNTNELHFDFIRREFPIVNEFDQLILSHEVKSRKPEREIYEEILKRTHVRPEEVLFVDDMEQNVRGAEELGIKAHLFTGAAGLRDRLALEGITGV